MGLQQLRLSVSITNKWWPYDFVESGNGFILCRQTHERLWTLQGHLDPTISALATLDSEEILYCLVLVFPGEEWDGNPQLPISVSKRWPGKPDFLGATLALWYHQFRTAMKLPSNTVLHTCLYHIHQIFHASSPWNRRFSKKFHSFYPPVITNIAIESHHFLYENPLFLWPFSIAMLNYKRVSISIFFHAESPWNHHVSQVPCAAETLPEGYDAQSCDGLISGALVKDPACDFDGKTHYVNTRRCVYIYIYTCIWFLWTYIHMYLYIYIYIDIYLFIIRTCGYVCINIYIYMYV